MADADNTLVHKLLEQCYALPAIKMALQDEIVAARGAVDVRAAVAAVAATSPAANLVRNAAHAAAQRLPGGAAAAPQILQPAAGATQADNPEAAAALAAARARWQRLIERRLLAAQSLLPEVPLAAEPRSEEEVQRLRRQVPHLTETWERVGSSASPFTGGLHELAPDILKLLYDSSDLLEAISSSANARRWLVAGAAAARGSLLWAVRAPSRPWLQSFFADLRADLRQVGLDDELHPWFREQQVAQARRALASGSAAACRAAARTGLPPSERPAAWACALGLPPPAGGGGGSGGWEAGSGNGAQQQQQQQQQREGTRPPGVGLGCYAPSARDEGVFRLLCEGAERQALLADALSLADACGVADSEHYFPFAEAVRAMVLAFSRDASICRNARATPLPRLASEGRGGRLRAYPPSGVLPFCGLAALAAPVASLYRSPTAAYRVFSALYCRHWSALHGLGGSGAPAPGTAVLCRTFVDLLEELDPEVARHLDAIGLPALEVAFPWMYGAFAAHLPPREALLLWDRVIGFDSLLPLPLLAVAVLTFRRDLILSAASPDELSEAVEDLGQLRVVPLLQALLFDAP
ncbi:MAG: hypothetical protein J3K34DRAFT_527500 [Monoraphidium minutum]|nr:MAG: hypothetical protein J3K34DRAFT_527500 [Monoraphidium minutum]